MRRLALALVLTTCRPTATATPATACTGAVTDAAWLAGSWRGQSGEVEEHWTIASGRTMLGLGRTVIQGGTMAFEFMRIEERADGLVFVAHPSAGPGVEFRRTACGPGLLRFENPTHDFPKVIEYRRTGDDAIVANVEGDSGDGGKLGHALELRREGPP